MSRFVARLVSKRILEIQSKPCRVAVSRTFLSETYGQVALSPVLTSEVKGSPNVALQSLHLDRCMEKNLLVTSLMLDRIIRSAQSQVEMSAMKYYLHKFHFSVNNYYLHPWTSHVFSEKCLEFCPDTFLDVIQNKIHYGVYPHVVVLNQFLDKFLKDGNMEDALHIVSHIFLCEHLQNETTQALVVKFITKFWEQNKVDGSFLPNFSDLESKRNLAGCLYCIGVFSSINNLKIIGQSILGNIERENGIRSVYQDPWGPLSWEEGLLEKSLENLRNSDDIISTQTVNILKECIGDDGQLRAKFEEVCDTKKNLIQDELNLEEICENLMKNLPGSEMKDRDMMEKTLEEWIQEREDFYQSEEEIIQEKREQREKYQQSKKVDQLAHQGAVEELGFWFMEDSDKKIWKKTEKKLPVHMREDYIDGTMSDLEIIERFRMKRGIIKDPIMLIPELKQSKQKRKKQSREKRKKVAMKKR